MPPARIQKSVRKDHLAAKGTSLQISRVPEFHILPALGRPSSQAFSRPRCIRSPSDAPVAAEPAGHGVAFARTICRGPREIPVQGSNSTFPVVARDSSARCASAVRANGKVAPIRTRSDPSVIHANRSAALARNSAEVAT